MDECVQFGTGFFYGPLCLWEVVLYDIHTVMSGPRRI